MRTDTHGVTVNAISPGPTSTAKGRLTPEQIAAIEAHVPIGRFGEAHEMAWDAEVERRLAAYDRGELVALGGKSVLAKARALARG